MSHDGCPRFEVIVIENDPNTKTQTAQIAKGDDLEDVMIQFKQIVKEIKKTHEDTSSSNG